MEATAAPGSIQVTKELIQILGSGFEVVRDKDIDVKGKGVMERYVLSGFSG